MNTSQTPPTCPSLNEGGSSSQGDCAKIKCVSEREREREREDEREEEERSKGRCGCM